MGRISERKRDDTVAKNNHVKVGGLQELLAGFIQLEKGPKANKVILFEELDLLSGFLHHNILCSKRMDGESPRKCADFGLGWVDGVQPPHAPIRAKLEEVPEAVARKHQVAQVGSVHGALRLG
jgi:hypothetical protein